MNTARLGVLAAGAAVAVAVAFVRSAPVPRHMRKTRQARTAGAWLLACFTIDAHPPQPHPKR